MCAACHVDAQLSFWDRRVYLNHRLDIFWDRVENSFLSMWQGDKNEDFRPRIPNSPFIRENEKERIIDLMESGQGKLHTCVQSRIPNNLEMQPFLPPGSIWKSKGKSGYTAKIRISVLGMVEQNPEGRWQWVSIEKLRLAIPGPMISVLGEWIEIDGWIRLSGERLTRKKRRFLEFKERESGKILEGVPVGTKLVIEWEERFMPTTCHGVHVWGVYASLVEWASAG